MTLLPASERAEIRRLCAVATPGPWITDSLGYHIEAQRPPRATGIEDLLFVGRTHERRDAAFIASARAAVPRLLEALSAVETERDKLRDLLVQARTALEDGDAQDEMARVLQAEEDSWTPRLRADERTATDEMNDDLQNSMDRDRGDS